MSDARRRQLERDVARGDADARAAWLRERLRAGELTRERLLLAAHLGDVAAREAVSARDGAQDDDDAWLRALGAFSEEVAVRAVLAAAGLSTAFRLALASPDARLVRGFERGCGWAVAACRAEHLLEADGRARALAWQQRSFADRYGAGAGLTLQVGPAGCRCVCAGVAALDAPLLLARLSDPLAVPWLADAEGLTADRVRAEVAADLLPWALAT